MKRNLRTYWLTTNVSVWTLGTVDRRGVQTLNTMLQRGAGGHRRAPLLEIAVNRLDPDDLSLHASVPGPCVANLRS